MPLSPRFDSVSVYTNYLYASIYQSIINIPITWRQSHSHVLSNTFNPLHVRWFLSRPIYSFRENEKEREREEKKNNSGKNEGKKCISASMSMTTPVVGPLARNEIIRIVKWQEIVRARKITNISSIRRRGSFYSCSMYCFALSCDTDRACISAFIPYFRFFHSDEPKDQRSVSPFATRQSVALTA